MKNNEIVRKMIRYIEKIEEYTKSYDYEKFISNSIVVEACVFNLSQIGELANHVDSDYMETYKEIPWRQVYD